MDVATVRMRLEGMLQEIDRSIRVLKGEPVPPHERSAADGAADLFDTDRVRAMLHVAGQQRTAVLAALKRLDDGGYGQCVDCGKPVPEGRLEARPEAARCVACQSRTERRR
ncbi:TraR/DksA family transcriptional regulator [Microbispora sp. NPDC049125]|uniref:TraR/DksA family transcriptional regulator n=1 Tax=Microbispora sp. NPDC049125 TaxID=3154929 RepID=UPI00346613D2